MSKLLTPEAAEEVFSTETGRSFLKKGGVHYLSTGSLDRTDPSRAPVNQWSDSMETVDPVSALHTVQNAEAEIVANSKAGHQR